MCRDAAHELAAGLMGSEQHGADQPVARSPTESVSALSERLDSIDRITEPVAWATAAYRLGMATAEQPTAQPDAAMRQALELYHKASQVLTATRAPVEHARVLNAAGSAHRMLGDISTAARLFRESLALMSDRGVESEEASVWNNLGLVLSEGGRFDEQEEAVVGCTAIDDVDMLDVAAGDSDEEPFVIAVGMTAEGAVEAIAEEAELGATEPPSVSLGCVAVSPPRRVTRASSFEHAYGYPRQGAATLPAGATPPRNAPSPVGAGVVAEVDMSPSGHSTMAETGSRVRNWCSERARENVHAWGCSYLWVYLQIALLYVYNTLVI